jgi:hypothetical protein
MREPSIQMLTLKRSQALGLLLLTVLLVGFTIPFIQEKREQYVYEQMLTLVEDSLNQAQTLAISEQSQVTLHVSPDQNSFQFERAQSTPPAAHHTNNTVSNNTLAPEFTLEATLPVVFNPRGYVTSAEPVVHKLPSLELKFQNKTIRKITVYPSGALSVE